MAKNISVAKQILGILEDAGRPLYLKEIVSAFSGDYDGPYVMARLIDLRKSKKISSNIQPDCKNAIYFINNGDENEKM